MLLITPGERNALKLLAKGEGAHEIASCLGVGEGDFETSIAILLTKMGASSLADAIAAGVKRGLLTTTDGPRLEPPSEPSAGMIPRPKV